MGEMPAKQYAMKRAGSGSFLLIWKVRGEEKCRNRKEKREAVLCFKSAEAVVTLIKAMKTTETKTAAGSCAFKAIWKAGRNCGDGGSVLLSPQGTCCFGRDRKGKVIKGVYKEGTHILVPVEKCLLENEKAGEIITTIQKLLPSFKIKTYDEDTGYGLLRHVLVRVGHATGQIMVVLVLGSPILPSKNNLLKALRKSIRKSQR